MNTLVTVIVPHHLDENAPYLKLCLDSILSSEVDFEYEVLLLADTENPPEFESHENLIVYWGKELVTASSKFNWAARVASGKYLWLISDDVMVSKYAMRCMVEGMGENSIICNPMSNSDNGSQFFADLGLPVKCSIEDLPLIPLENLNRALKPFLIPVRNFISFYCTMIPKRLWDLVGNLDEEMEYRHNDQDWCLRAMKIGIIPMINLGAFALHFGDKTIPKCATPKQLEECSKVFHNKWSRQN